MLIPFSEVEWGPLNPARGDASPRAGDLWGDRTGTGATGFLVQFADGFSSPPHIHNVTYRGVVIRGLLHNDDPDAEEMWLPPGSFWAQPAGDVHITAADAGANLAYIEIQDGPYLVQPTDEAFASDDVEVNLDASNLIWLDASDLAWVDAAGDAASGPKVALLWGDPQGDEASGSLVELPAGSAGTIHGHGPSLRVVVVEGRLGLESDETTAVPLEPGSYVGSEGPSAHEVSCGPGADCVVYVRSEGGFEIAPAQPGD
jgi:quercetin dioxygenase-like cupin family protein